MIAELLALLCLIFALSMALAVVAGHVAGIIQNWQAALAVRWPRIFGRPADPPPPPFGLELTPDWVPEPEEWT